MAFKIIRNDITKVRADAIVNTANPMPVVGKGTDTAVYNAAGREALLEARCKIGEIEQGQSVWTDSFGLKKHGVKYIIHTVGKSYEEDSDLCIRILRSCYATSLSLAKSLGCKSVAIPLLATGFYGFPKELGLKIAVDEISGFLLKNEIEIILVVYDKQSYFISEKLFNEVQDFLDENCLTKPLFDNCCLLGESAAYAKSLPRKKARKFSSQSADYEAMAVCGEKAAPANGVDEYISQAAQRMNFQNTLQSLIAERRLQNAEVYSKAQIDRRFFSKMISKKNYVPKKMTVMALGLALELPLAGFEDFLASAGYALMPSSRFDMIVKYCVINNIYNIIEVDFILASHNESCFINE